MRNDNIDMDRLACEILKKCGDAKALSKARQVHSCILENFPSLHLSIYIGNRILGVYQKCGSLDDACWIFERMPEKDVITWNIMILAYSQDGYDKDAFQLFEKMKKHCVEPSRVTFLNILKACSNLSQGERVFTLIKDIGLESDLVVGNALLSMFGKCGSLAMAVKTFFTMRQRDAVTWTTMISTYIQHGKVVQALEMFKQINFNGEITTIMTYAVILNGVANPVMLAEGQLIHIYLVKVGYESLEVLGCALITMYSKCGMIEDAHQIFVAISKLDVITWNSMISGFLKHGDRLKVFDLYCQMHHTPVCPNSVTIISTLDACTNLAALKEGMLIHVTLLDMRITSNAVWNALLNMYGACGSPSDAFATFKKMQKRDVVTWTSLIQVFGQSNQIDKALQAYQNMQLEGIQPNMVTILNIVKVCIDHCALIDGQLMHAVIVEKYFELDLLISNALITMYGICGSATDAHYVFTALPTHDHVSWTAVIVAHAQNGCENEAFAFLLQMLGAGLTPMDVTFVSIMDAISSFTALETGMMVHFLFSESGKECNLILGNAFMNFYAKCDRLDEVSCLFNSMQDRDIVSCTALMTAYGNQGKVEEAFSVLCEFHETGLEPDNIMFVSIFCACSHTGLITEGLCIFHLMVTVCEILPSEELFRSIVDLLSRAGWVGRVESLLNHLPKPPTFAAWMTLLSACRIHNNMARGEHVAEHVLELNFSNPAGYVILSNICISAEMEFEADQTQKIMGEIGVIERFNERHLGANGLNVFKNFVEG